MPLYTKYPNSKETPSRLSRKGSRNKIFQANKMANRKQKSERAALKLKLAESSRQED